MEKQILINTNRPVSKRYGAEQHTQNDGIRTSANSAVNIIYKLNPALQKAELPKAARLMPCLRNRIIPSFP